MRYCPRCQRNRRLSSFSMNRNGTIRGYCKECNVAYASELRRRDPFAFDRFTAVSMFRKYRDDPEFWRAVDAADARAARKVAAA